MLANFFDRITRLSLRFRWVTIGLTAVILIAGIYAMTGLNQEMLPRIEFPQTIIVAQWADAEDSDQFLQEVTIPLEDNLSSIDGVVNVESTTSAGFAFIIVRYDFGLNQERIAADIEGGIEAAGLPEGVEPDLLNFSFSDLPVVVTSVSSSELTLAELKEIVESDLQPRLEALDEINQVSISGGQELPDESELADESVDEPEEEAAVVEEPGRLPSIVVDGGKALGVEIEYAQDISVDMLSSLSQGAAAEEQVMAVLFLLPLDVLAYLPPETMSFLPVEFVATLDADLVAELDGIAAEFGGVAQYTISEATAILSGAETAMEGGPAELEGEVVEETAPVPSQGQTVPFVELPDSWAVAGAAAGFDLIITSDLTPEVMGGIVSFAPDLLSDLTPEMWRSIAPDAVAAVLSTVADTMEPALLAQLGAIQLAANGVAPAAVGLPSAWIAAAEYVGLTVETTAEIDATAVSLIAESTPDLLEVLNEEIILGFAPDVQAALPADYVATLDGGLQQTLANVSFYHAQLSMVADGGELPQVESVDLPESWIAGAAAAGQEIETTSDVTAEIMGGIVGFAPEQLAELTPEMWRAFDPEVTAVALATNPELDADLLAQLQAIQWSAVGSAPEPAPLPESWIVAAAAVGQTVETTADFPPEALGQLAAFAPELLNDLTQETLLGLSAPAIAALPAEYVAGLDAGLQQTLANVVVWNAHFVAAMEAVESDPVVEAAPEPEVEVDPARLPDLLIQGAQAAGLEIEFAQDVPADFIRQMAAFGPQGLQALQLLTQDNIRLLVPEAIALLPAEFLESLDDDFRAELDEIAAEFGGAGQLALTEAEEAAALSADSPPLNGIWLEPNPEGEPSIFLTAADILNNPFLPGAAAFLNVFPDSPNVENPLDWMSTFTPEIIQFFVENEDDFIQNMSPIVLELFAPETLIFMLETYPDAFDADLAERLQGIAAGDIELFIPEATITRTDGDPSVIVNLFKNGDANTVIVAHRIFDELDAIKADFPEIETSLVFEQATFIEDSIEGVSREGTLGAVFAILIILLFLSGRVGGKYKLSLRATMVTAVSIPLSIFTAFLFMRFLPPTVGVWMQGLSESSDNGVITFLARLFPTSITLNIMTLSGLTVAIGRVVDDSIVVLENSYRYIQKGMDPKEAVLRGTKEVAAAIFSATVITMAVFLPLGLIGGIIGSFFLPFGLAVAYALAGSFVVSITVVPAMTYLLIRQEHIPEERETAMQRWYTPMLEWSLAHRGVTMGIATAIFVASLFLLGLLPQSFIPGIGEPTINVTVNLPTGTLMADTDGLVMEFETAVSQLDGIEQIQTEIGGAGGFEAFFGGGGVSQNQANLTLTIENQDDLNALANEVRQEGEAIFGEKGVSVSGAAQSGFSGFALIITGDSLEELTELNEDVKAAIGAVDVDEDGIPDIANVVSNIENGGLAGDAPIIRIDGRPAISFGGELETQNTLGVTNVAKQAIVDVGLPDGVEVTEGFDSEQQVEGFKGMLTAIGYSIIIAYAIMALTFGSFIHPFTILFSIPFALVGAAIALYISNSVLGISAMIGFMMLIGVVVTNGIVLMELVQQLRKKGKGAYDALMEAGRTRLRPIWMTALTAILALIPLAFSSTEGAIIAKELARAVMGGLIVSTALTLIVIPVVYSLFDQLVSRKKG